MQHSFLGFCPYMEELLRGVGTRIPAADPRKIKCVEEELEELEELELLPSVDPPWAVEPPDCLWWTGSLTVPLVQPKITAMLVREKPKFTLMPVLKMPIRKPLFEQPLFGKQYKFTGTDVVRVAPKAKKKGGKKDHNTIGILWKTCPKEMIPTLLGSIPNLSPTAM
jgi:hypothetical protein